MDWGLGNPNKTAILIGCLMAACWMLARIRRAGFALALGSFVALGACLIHTYSRGGLLAAAAGQLVLLARADRPWRRGRAIAVSVALAAIAAYANWDAVGAARRLGLSFEGDRSITNRLAIWRAAPRMMVDAPAGWGWGRSGWAFSQWYQDPSTRYEYHSLVNSHLTWMVEMGWPGRCTYVAVAMATLVLCWPRRGASAVPLAVWVTFLSGATFSSTMEAPALWILPALALGHASWHRVRAHEWPPKTAWLAIAATSAGALLAIAIAGTSATHGPRIHGSPEVTHVGTAGPLFLLPDPDVRILGTHYGAEIRRLASDPQRPGQWLVSRGLRLPKVAPENPDGMTIILSGQPSEPTLRALEVFQNASLILLNSLDGTTLDRISGGHRGPLRAFFGQRRSDSGAREVIDVAKARGIDHVVVRGAAMYLRQWPSFVTEQKATQNE